MADVRPIDPREHTQKLIDIYTRRLQELEKQIALTGYYNGPPERILEAEQLRAAIAGLEMYRASAPDKLIDRRDPQIEERLHTMVSTIMATVGEVANVKHVTRTAIDELRSELYRTRTFALWAIVAYAFVQVGLLAAVVYALVQAH